MIETDDRRGVQSTLVVRKVFMLNWQQMSRERSTGLFREIACISDVSSLRSHCVLKSVEPIQN